MPDFIDNNQANQEGWLKRSIEAARGVPVDRKAKHCLDCDDPLETPIRQASGYCVPCLSDIEWKGNR